MSSIEVRLERDISARRVDDPAQTLPLAPDPTALGTLGILLLASLLWLWLRACLKGNRSR